MIKLKRYPVLLRTNLKKVGNLVLISHAPKTKGVKKTALYAGKNMVISCITHTHTDGCLRGLVGSMLDNRSLPPEFESQHGHILRVFHL